jgi:hypothetical protein
VTQPLAALALLAAGAGHPDWARTLAADPAAERRLQLAACPGLPPDVRETLASDPDVRVVAEVASRATPEMAARLANHPYADVRRALAGNEAAPPAVLAALITGDGLSPARWCLGSDGDAESAVGELDAEDVQLRAVQNPATPPAAVAGFADHPSLLLRWQLAARRDLPAETYERLAASPEPGVRATLAGNPAIGAELIRGLAADPGYDVQRSVAHHPDVPLEVVVALAAATRIGPTLLPRIATASRPEIERLAASPDPVVRMLLAARRDLPAEIRDALAADPDAKVAKSIAPHPGLSEARLRAMVDRHGVRVVAAVAANPDAPPALLADLARHRPPVRKALLEIARHPRATAPVLHACLSDERARRVAAGHPALPPQTIVDLLADDDWQVVEAAAANPALPPAAMSTLLP